MDWTMDDVGEEPAGTVREREICPEGEHLFEIRAATEGAHKFKEGEFLMLRLSPVGGSYQFVFCDIEKGSRGARLASQLAAALGIWTGGKVSIAPADCEGRTVKAEIYHKVGTNGRTYVNVGKFLAEQSAPAEAPAKKSKSKPAASEPLDDIPF